MRLGAFVAGYLVAALIDLWITVYRPEWCGLQRIAKHPRADALMALHPRDFEAFLRGVGIRTASDESGWTRSLDELPDPFAEAFGDA